MNSALEVETVEMGERLLLRGWPRSIDSMKWMTANQHPLPSSIQANPNHFAIPSPLLPTDYQPFVVTCGYGCVDSGLGLLSAYYAIVSTIIRYLLSTVVSCSSQ